LRLAALSIRERSTDGARSEAGDRVLIVGLVVACSLIVLNVLVLLAVGGGSLLAPG